jgi:hypothetical protein
LIEEEKGRPAGPAFFNSATFSLRFMESTYTYKVLPHEGVTHLVFNGRHYALDKLTEAEMALLYGKTPFVSRRKVASARRKATT